MTAKIEFQLALFGSDSNQEYTQRTILMLTEALARVDFVWLQEHPTWPQLYKSGIVYKNDDPGHETMKDLPTMLSTGWGDCASLAPARCAELRIAAARLGSQYQHFKFRPFIRWRKGRDSVWRFHVLVKWVWPNGKESFEDPSKILGMTGE